MNFALTPSKTSIINLDKAMRIYLEKIRTHGRTSVLIVYQREDRVRLDFAEDADAEQYYLYLLDKIGLLEEYNKNFVKKCSGKNCNATRGTNHSKECQKEHDDNYKEL